MIVTCVLKSGGDYDEQYVRNLFKMVERNMFINKFICFSDLPEKNFRIKDPRFIVWKLEHNYPGWWSKFEIFCLPGKVLYFDLDTVIFSLDDLLDVANRLENNDIIGVKAFNPKRNTVERTKFNSGIMSWNGDFKFILNQFNYEKMSVAPDYIGDQDWIHEIAKKNRRNIRFWQEEGIKMYSYKRDCQKSLPEDASIVCFHGRPRPHEIVNEVSWVKDFWDIGEK